MKSLVESLFDKNNITKDLTFGDVFKLVDVKVFNPKKDSGWESGRTIDKLYDYNTLSKDSGIKGFDVEDTVVKSLEKLVCNIPITKNMHHKDIDDIIRGFTRYYKSIVNKTMRLKAASWPGIFAHTDKDKYPDDSPYDGDIQNFLRIINNWKIMDNNIKKVDVKFLRIEFTFERK